MNKKQILLCIMTLLLIGSLSYFDLKLYSDNQKKDINYFGKGLNNPTYLNPAGIPLSQGNIIVGGSSGYGEATSTIRTDSSGNFYNNDMGVWQPTGEKMMSANETIVTSFQKDGYARTYSYGTTTYDTTTYLKGVYSLKTQTDAVGNAINGKKTSISPAINATGKNWKIWVMEKKKLKNY